MNVEGKYQTFTDCSGAGGPAGTAAVFSLTEYERNTRFKYPNLKTIHRTPSSEGDNLHQQTLERFSKEHKLRLEELLKCHLCFHFIQVCRLVTAKVYLLF